MKLEEQLKAAIVRMPVSDKDKLLLRLVAKDVKLVRRLVFELVEGGETRDERAAELKGKIANALKPSNVGIASPDFLLYEFRYWNTRITEHVQATKDKVGEVSLSFFMLAEGIRNHSQMLQKYSSATSSTVSPYLIKRMKILLVKAEKVHEDYFIEFRRDVQELLEHIWEIPALAIWAKELGLPRYWDK